MTDRSIRTDFEKLWMGDSTRPLLRSGEGYKHYECNQAWRVFSKASEVMKERAADVCRELYANDGITCAEEIMEIE